MAATNCRSTAAAPDAESAAVVVATVLEVDEVVRACPPHPLTASAAEISAVAAATSQSLYLRGRPGTGGEPADRGGRAQQCPGICR